MLPSILAADLAVRCSFYTFSNVYLPDEALI
jgi:hypothetical protein